MQQSIRDTRSVILSGNSECKLRNLSMHKVRAVAGHGDLGPHRPLSRRLDRCDRVIHNESGDPNGGNMCSFPGATCTSRVRHNADYVPYAKIRFDL